MQTDRIAPAKTDAGKLLWAGLAVVLIIVLAMGATLIHVKNQPEEPRLAVLASNDAPGADVPTAASTATAADSAASTSPPASTPTASIPLVVETQKPRTVQLPASEPAVARAR